MCKVQMLRALVKQRLTAAAEEICGLFERTIAEYEEELSRSKEENERQQKLLDAVLHPQLQLHRADVQQLLVVKEEVPPEQHEWSSSLDQEDPEPPHIKEEQKEHWISQEELWTSQEELWTSQEELWTSQEGEQLQGLEEADITNFPFTPVPVKSEDDEEKPQSSQLYQTQTEQMETKADGEDCGGPKPARNSDPDRHPARVSDSKCSDSEKKFSCSECGKRFGYKTNLNIHLRFHKGEKPFSCSICTKAFTQRGDLQKHMRIHLGEKPYSCSVCNKSFTESGNLQQHKRTHTGEKRFSCSFCKKPFTHSRSLQKHIRVHTGEKLFSCSVCKKDFTENGSLKKHMRIHTGEKPFSCSVCKKHFSENGSLKKHLRIHTGEKPFRCSVCDRAFRASGHVKMHMRTHTGRKPFSC
ncbi:zinc finger protein 771-like [Sebastes umbrosus]|uniref:zinc finger protein 771-like n=1 Tax=Sebastes umbrosus TaxID=72105 RepID=UPI00189ED787|nr:zinc finger protein 771-like [Sebastes umbrosus]